MKKNILFIAAVLLFLDGCASGIHGSGNVVTEKRQVGKFSGIELQCSANVYLTQGDETSVTVEAEDNITPVITTAVKDGNLIVSSEKNYSSTQPVNVYVTVKELCLVDLAGSGNMIGRNMINCDYLVLRIEGSGDMKMDVRSLAVKMNLSGSGNLTVSGSTANTDIRISGSGNVNAESMKTYSGVVSISGSGMSKINATDELSVDITGSGNVMYVSEPLRLKKSITGSGTITKI